MNEVNEASDLKADQSHVLNSIIFPNIYQQMKNNNILISTSTTTS